MSFKTSIWSGLEKYTARLFSIYISPTRYFILNRIESCTAEKKLLNNVILNRKEISKLSYMVF